MTPASEPERLELFLMSPRQTPAHVELMTVIAHCHQTGARLGLGHTINFGRPWLEESRCDYGLISLPYLFGPPLERARIGAHLSRVLWLIPITRDEREFKIASGLDALEARFEEVGFNYLDPLRPSVVGEPES